MKETSKIVQNRAKFILKSENLILWHVFVNNSITHSAADPRTPLNAEELVAEILKIERVIGTVYCVRKGAIDERKQLKATEIPVLHIVNDLLAKRK